MKLFTLLTGAALLLPATTEALIDVDFSSVTNVQNLLPNGQNSAAAGT